MAVAAAHDDEKRLLRSASSYLRKPNAITQCAARGEATVEGAGGTNAPPAGPSGVCAAPAARPGTSRDSVQAVVLRGRHWRPVTSPMTQLGGRVECPSLPPWCTYHDEPSCLIAPSVETPPRAHVKARSRRYPACSCVPEDNNVTPRKVEVLVPVGAASPRPRPGAGASLEFPTGDHVALPTSSIPGAILRSMDSRRSRDAWPGQMRLHYPACNWFVIGGSLNAVTSRSVGNTLVQLETTPSGLQQPWCRFFWGPD